jgi:hypothetical protein
VADFFRVGLLVAHYRNGFNSVGIPSNFELHAT